VSWRTFKLLYRRFIQDNVYQILSYSTGFCGRYDKNILVCFFGSQCDRGLLVAWRSCYVLQWNSTRWLRRRRHSTWWWSMPAEVRSCFIIHEVVVPCSSSCMLYRANNLLVALMPQCISYTEDVVYARQGKKNKCTVSSIKTQHYSRPMVLWQIWDGFVRYSLNERIGHLINRLPTRIDNCASLSSLHSVTSPISAGWAIHINWSERCLCVCLCVSGCYPGGAKS